MFKKLFIIALALSFAVPVSFATDVKESTVSVDYSMAKTVAPDTAVIKFYVENSGTNIGDIKEKNDKIVNEAISKIKQQLNQDEQVRTIAYQINNVYSYKDKVRIFQKYQMTNGFEVKLKDMSKISKIIKIATDAGVKTVDNLSFSLENSQEECNKLIADTVKGAKTRAVYVANALATSLDKVKTVNPYCSVNSSIRPRYLNSFKASMAEDASVSAGSQLDTIEPGEINLRSNVNMVYYLK